MTFTDDKLKYYEQIPVQSNALESTQSLPIWSHFGHILVLFFTNENSIRISDWDVKGTIFIDNNYDSVGSFHWVCKKCLYLWDQYWPDKGSVFDPDINKKEMKNYKTCSGCGDAIMYCTCFG